MDASGHVRDTANNNLMAKVSVSEKRSGIRQFFLAAGICCLVYPGCEAQHGQSGARPDAPSAIAQSQTESRGDEPLKSEVAFVQLLQRKSLVFPDLATDKGPLTSWDKFQLAANNSISLSTISVCLAGSGYNQATNFPSGYGQGGEGYGKRLGSCMARVSSDYMFGTFVLASVLHEDPRFYIERDLTLKEAVKYSALMVFFTRSDSGNRVVNFAGLLGPAVGEGLANTYWPQANRSIGNTLIRYSADEGWKFGRNLMRQYWPKVNRKLRLVPRANNPERATMTQGDARD